MMIGNSTTQTNVSNRSRKYIYWNAIIAGAIVAVGITVLFNLLTIGVGFALFNRTPGSMMALTFATVGWMVVGSYMTLFIAGWVSGRLIHNEYSFHLSNGMLHGFATWSLYLIICILLLSLMTQSVSATILKSFFINLSMESTTAQNATSPDVHKLGYATLVTFSIFFFGAVGSCIGAACGIHESRKYHENR
jgi:hypothetical protein